MNAHIDNFRKVQGDSLVGYGFVTKVTEVYFDLPDGNREVVEIPDGFEPHYKQHDNLCGYCFRIDGVVCTSCREAREEDGVHYDEDERSISGDDIVLFKDGPEVLKYYLKDHVARSKD